MCCVLAYKCMLAQHVYAYGNVPTCTQGAICLSMYRCIDKCMSVNTHACDVGKLMFVSELGVFLRTEPRWVQQTC